MLYDNSHAMLELYYSFQAMLSFKTKLREVFSEGFFQPLLCYQVLNGQGSKLMYFPMK